MPGNLNTGVIRLEGEVQGGAALIRVEIYYDPAASEPRPIREVPGRIENGPQTRDRAMRCWNTATTRTVQCSVTDQNTGETRVVAIPGGGDLVVPVVTMTAAQLANWGITTQDAARSLSLTILG
jgi:hypothetical protein